MRSLQLGSVAEVAAVAQKLAPTLHPGDVVGLCGPLGAGKTTFVQALGQALGVTDAIVSPTFALIHEYAGTRFPLLHVDFYRLGAEGATRLEPELVSTMPGAVTLAEWADLAPFMGPWITVALQFSITGPTARTLTVIADRPEVLAALD
jgi:tRNA threonylcarbamoyladenosine biosynthesis protein TsaE